MMEVPDIMPWVRPGEMLVTSGYPLREAGVAELSALVQGLAHRGLAGLCIKLGRYLDRLPPAVVSMADREAFPVLSMPAELAFTDLLNAVLTELIERHETTLRTSEEVDRLLLQILAAGGAHAEVARRLSDSLSATVVITDADGTVVGAFAETIPPALVDSHDPLRLSPQTLAESAKAQAGGGFVVVQVRSGGIDHGFLVAAPAEGFDMEAALTLRRAAPIVALSFARRSEVLAVEAKYRGEFLRDVLTGTVRDGEDLREHATRLGWDLDRPLTVAVAQLCTPKAGEYLFRLATGIGRAVGTRWPGAAVHGFSSEVVLVLPTDAELQLEPLLRDVRAHIPAPVREFEVGVGTQAQGWRDVPGSYQQAREALRVGQRRLDPGQELQPFRAGGGATRGSRKRRGRFSHRFGRCRRGSISAGGRCAVAHGSTVHAASRPAGGRRSARRPARSGPVRRPPPPRPPR